MDQTKTKILEIEQEIEDVLKRPVHLKVEHFFRKPVILFAAVALTAVVIAKSDGKFMGVISDAYQHGYSAAGSYLRKETVHTAHALSVARIPVAAGH